jgi:hypothetical protein
MRTELVESFIPPISCCVRAACGNNFLLTRPIRLGLKYLSCKRLHVNIKKRGGADRGMRDPKDGSGLLLAQEPTGTQLLNGRRRTRRIVAGFGALAAKAARHR